MRTAFESYEAFSERVILLAQNDRMAIVKELKAFSAKYRIPIILNGQTYEGSRLVGHVRLGHYVYFDNQ